MKKKSQKSTSKLKKELDNIFSLFIRLRNADSSGIISCFTCGCKKHYKSGMHCGHFQSRKFLCTRFSETNCQNQCAGCNIFKYGEQYKFAVELDLKYGEGTAARLEQDARGICKISRAEYIEQITYYKRLVENLKLENQIE